MGNFRIESGILRLPARTYLIERDSAAFRALLAKTLKLGKMEILETRKEGDSTFVKVVTAPELGSWVPKPLRKHLEGSRGLEYYDTLEYNPGLLSKPPYKLPAISVPSFFTDRVEISTTLTIEEIDPDSCRQILEGYVKVKLLGMGKMIEDIIVESLRKSYESLAQLVERWSLVREELLQQPGGAEQLLPVLPAEIDLIPVPKALDGIDVDVQRSLQEPYVPGPLVPHRKRFTPTDLDKLAAAASVSPKSPAGGEVFPLLRVASHPSLPWEDAVDMGPEGDVFATPERQLGVGRNSFEEWSGRSMRSSSATEYFDAGVMSLCLGCASGCASCEGVMRASTAEAIVQDRYQAFMRGSSENVFNVPEELVLPADSVEDNGHFLADYSDTSEVEVEERPSSRGSHRSRSTKPRHHRRNSLPFRFSMFGANRWSNFNGDYVGWSKLWDRMGVAEYDMPQAPARLLHLLAFMQSWGLVKIVQPKKGVAAKHSPATPPLVVPHEVARGRKRTSSYGKDFSDVAQEMKPNLSDKPGYAKLRGRWMFACFGCYVPQEQFDDRLRTNASGISKLHTTSSGIKSAWDGKSNA